MIKLFLCDVDATLTDGVYQMSEEGVVSKNFFTRDFHGLWMLDHAGVEICIITAAGDDVITHQCSRGAKYAEVIKRTKDKVESIRVKYVDGGPQIQWDEIAFIGDDVFDEALMHKVGLAACPSDADSAIKLHVAHHDDGFISNFPGGRGCVRDFAEYVLKVNEREKYND